MVHRKPRTPISRSRKRASSLHLQLAGAIGEGILNGTYAPGTLLPNEAEWGAMFGASRTAVREAIKTLNGKGLLVSRPKIGSRVEPRERWKFLDRDVLAWHCAAMDRKQLLLSIQEMRRIFEPGAAALAAERRTEAQVARIAAALDGMGAARNAEEMVAPDVEFHLALQRWNDERQIGNARYHFGFADAQRATERVCQQRFVVCDARAHRDA